MADPESKNEAYERFMSQRIEAMNRLAAGGPIFQRAGIVFARIPEGNARSASREGGMQSIAQGEHLLSPQAQSLAAVFRIEPPAPLLRHRLLRRAMKAAALCRR